MRSASRLIFKNDCCIIGSDTKHSVMFSCDCHVRSIHPLGTAKSAVRACRRQAAGSLSFAVWISVNMIAAATNSYDLRPSVIQPSARSGNCCSSRCRRPVRRREYRAVAELIESMKRERAKLSHHHDAVAKRWTTCSFVSMRSNESSRTVASA